MQKLFGLNLFFVMVSLSCCSSNNLKAQHHLVSEIKPIPAPLTHKVEQADLIEHKVTYEGETLSLIALWYTGKANWEPLLKATPGLQSHLHINDIVLIPKNLAILTDKMPKSFIPRQDSQKNINQPTRTSKKIVVKIQETNQIQSNSELIKTQQTRFFSRLHQQ